MATSLRALCVSASIYAAASSFGCTGCSSPPVKLTPDAGPSTDAPPGSPDLAGAAGSSAPEDASDSRATGGAGGTGGSGGGQAAGSAGGGPAGSAGGACPTAPPFDDSNAALVSACAVPIAVAVGNGLRRALTRDGTTWDHDVYLPDTGTDQNENSHRDVLIARGLIFVIGDGGLLVSADAGETFTVSRPGRYHDSALAYFQGVIWAISNLGTFSTTDGKTWKEYTGTTMLPGNLPGAFSATGGAAVPSPSLLLVVSNRSNSSRLFDGTTWTQQAFDPTTYGSLNSAAYANGRFAIVGGACCDKMPFAGLRATSPDGVTWTPLTNATAGTAATLRFGSILGLGTKFFATASQYDRRTYTSTDGLAWTVQTSNFGIGPATLFKGDYQGASGALIYRSTDGAAWTLVHTGIGDTKWGYSAVHAGVVLAR